MSAKTPQLDYEQINALKNRTEALYAVVTEMYSAADGAGATNAHLYEAARCFGGIRHSLATALGRLTLATTESARRDLDAWADKQSIPASTYTPGTTVSPGSEDVQSPCTPAFADRVDY